MLEKLIDIANEKNIQVIYVSKEELRKRGGERGLWSLTVTPEYVKNIIYLQTDEMTELDQVITLSHELGHYHELEVDYEWNLERYAIVANLAWSPTVKLQGEQKAWMYSVKYLQQVGFKDWDFFLKTVDMSIETYYSCGFDFDFAFVKSKSEFMEDIKKTIEKESVV